MKKSAIYVWMILIILFGVIILGIGVKFSQKEVNSMRTGKVGGLMATWKYVEREIDLEYFYQLDNTTTYKQIEEEIGEPNGERGSGLIFPYYQVDSDLYVVVSFSLDEEGKYDKVGMLLLCNKDEVLEKIYPR
ncbi:MAG: hypothetical protein HDQ99_03420 [Lachnospiraceae bacterium]|nr:hypothetical protein [Lachnospiraceae bacterium]